MSLTQILSNLLSVALMSRVLHAHELLRFIFPSVLNNLPSSVAGAAVVAAAAFSAVLP